MIIDGNFACVVLCLLIIVPRSLIDDEYANALEKDPKILVTTSRNPSAPLIQFAKVGLELFTVPVYWWLLSIL